MDTILLRTALVMNVFVAAWAAPADQSLIAETAHEEGVLNWCWKQSEECKAIPYSVVESAVPNVIYCLDPYILDPNFANESCDKLGNDCCFLQQENQRLDELDILYDAGTPSELHSSFGFLGRQTDGTLVLSFTGTDFKDPKSREDSLNMKQKKVKYGHKRYTVHEGAHEAYMELYKAHDGYSGRHDDPSRPGYDTLERIKLKRAIFKAVMLVPGPVKMVVAGHSLGGAMASIAALHLINKYRKKLQIKLVTIGAYRVLNAFDAHDAQINLVQHSDKFGEPFPEPGFLSVQRWVNAGDSIPAFVPKTTVFGEHYSHFGHALLVIYDTFGTSGKRQYEFTQKTMDYVPYHAMATSYPRHMSMNYLKRMQKGTCPATDVALDLVSDE